MLIHHLFESTTTDGVYIGLKYDTDTNDSIIKLCKDNNIPNIISKDDIHTTLIYSRKHFENAGKLVKKTNLKYEIDAVGFELLGDDRDTLVLKLSSSDLQRRHSHFINKHKATHDWDAYLPHITLSYDVGTDFDISKLTLPKKFKITAISEYYEALQLNWSGKSEGDDDE